jgi:hypothetical protein
MKRKIISLALLIGLGACATMFDGSTQNINVSAINVATNKPLKGASCTVSDEVGAIYMVNENPGIVKVKKGQGALRFDCKKPGYAQKNNEVQESFNNTGFFNIFTLGSGFFVDAVTGAGLEYPTHVIIRMEVEE